MYDFRVVGTVEHEANSIGMADGMPILCALMAGVEGLWVSIGPARPEPAEGSWPAAVLIGVESQMILAHTVMQLLHRRRSYTVVTESNWMRMGSKPLALRPQTYTRTLDDVPSDCLVGDFVHRFGPLVACMPDIGPTYPKTRAADFVHVGGTRGRNRVQSLAPIRHRLRGSERSDGWLILRQMLAAVHGDRISMQVRAAADPLSEPLLEANLSCALAVVLADVMLLALHRDSASVLILDPYERMKGTEARRLLHVDPTQTGIVRAPEDGGDSGFSVESILCYMQLKGVPYRRRLPDGSLSDVKTAIGG